MDECFGLYYKCNMTTPRAPEDASSHDAIQCGANRYQAWPKSSRVHIFGASCWAFVQTSSQPSWIVTTTAANHPTLCDDL